MSKPKMFIGTDSLKQLVYGIQGSGKTHYSKEQIKEHNYTVLCFQVHPKDFEDEPDNFIVYKASNKDEMGNPIYTKEDFDVFCMYGKELAKQGQIDGLLIDEMDLLFQNNWDLSPQFNDLIINHRHQGCFVIGITRRPQDIPAKFVGQTHRHVIFAFDDPLAQKKFNGLYKDLGTNIRSLKYKSYDHYVKEIGEPSEFVKG